jgi:predicted DNA binding CopG/RHH family protein
LQHISPQHDQNTAYQKSPAITIVEPPAKPVAVDFNGGKLTSDAGAPLLTLADEKIQLTKRIDELISDPRDQDYITHQQRDLIAQRIYAIALGYEDVNDHITMRKDHALLTAVKNTADEEQPLGSASTLSRLENRITESELSELNKLFVKLFIESFDKPPKQLYFDADATDDIIHGNQEGRHYSAFYDNYIFLPLYIFCGNQLLWSQLRTSDKGQADGSLAAFHCIVEIIKQAWPDVEIIFRGDAGFYTPELLNYCEFWGYKYILGFSSNAVLKRLSANIVFAAEMFFVENGSQEPLRLFREYMYQAGTWKAPRKIIIKAERLPDHHHPLVGKENTRYVVTNLEGTPQHLYENVYCARGDMENRIKEQQRMLFSDRTSCHYFLANCFRLFLSSCAYVLIETIRRTALQDTPLENAQCDTIRLKLFKVAASVQESFRRILFSLPSSFPLKELWLLVADRLRLKRLGECLPEPSG